MTETSKSSLHYKHTDAAERNAFIAKLRTLSRSKSANVFKAFHSAKTGEPHGLDADDLTAAKTALFDLIVANTDDNDLLTTLDADHQDNGISALPYIS